MQGYGAIWTNDEDPDAIAQSRTRKCVFLVAFGAVLDSTAFLMSIQPFWYVLNGPPELYGVVFGGYDVAQMMCAPLLSAWASWRSSKEVLLICILINCIGNIMYGLGYWWSDSKWLVVSRMISGAGSASVVIGLSYLARQGESRERVKVVESYRRVQTVARLIGPQLGFLFLLFPEPKSKKMEPLTLFNFYTASGWTVAALSLVTFFAILFFYKAEDTQYHQHVISTINIGRPINDYKSMFSTVIRRLGILYLAQAVMAVCLWALMANLFTIAIGNYRLIDSQIDIWKIWIGVAVGSFLGWQTWRWTAWLDTNLIGVGIVGTFLGGLLLAVSPLLLGALPSDQYPQWRYYIGSTLLGLSSQLYFVSSTFEFSKELTVLCSQNHSFQSISLQLTSLFTMASPFGRFVAPILGSYLLHPKEDSGSDMCTHRKGIDVKGCCIQVGNYDVCGCVMTETMLLTSLVIAICICVFCHTIGICYNRRMEDVMLD